MAYSYHCPNAMQASFRLLLDIHIKNSVKSCYHQLLLNFLKLNENYAPTSIFIKSHLEILHDIATQKATNTYYFSLQVGDSVHFEDYVTLQQASLQS
jgi:hypothetical protein